MSRVMDVVVEKESAPWLQPDDDDVMVQIVDEEMRSGYTRAAYEPSSQPTDRKVFNGDLAGIDDSSYVVKEDNVVHNSGQMAPSQNSPPSSRPGGTTPPGPRRETSPTHQPGQRSQRISKSFISVSTFF